MPDLPRPPVAGDAVLETALHPRRFGIATVTLRRLAWPVLRAWLLPMSARLDQLGEQAEAAAGLHRDLGAAQAQLRALSDALADGGERERAAMAALRAEFSAQSAERDAVIADLRREVRALGTVVAHYRELVEPVLVAKDA